MCSLPKNAYYFDPTIDDGTVYHHCVQLQYVTQFWNKDVLLASQMGCLFVWWFLHRSEHRMFQACNCLTYWWHLICTTKNYTVWHATQPPGQGEATDDDRQFRGPYYTSYSQLHALIFIILYVSKIGNYYTGQLILTDSFIFDKNVDRTFWCGGIDNQWNCSRKYSKHKDSKKSQHKNKNIN